MRNLFLTDIILKLKYVVERRETLYELTYDFYESLSIASLESRKHTLPLFRNSKLKSCFFFSSRYVFISVLYNQEAILIIV